MPKPDKSYTKKETKIFSYEYLCKNVTESRSTLTNNNISQPNEAYSRSTSSMLERVIRQLIILMDPKRKVIIFLKLKRHLIKFGILGAPAWLSRLSV